MSSTCAVYFNYKNLVTCHGGKNAKAVAAVYINKVFVQMELSPVRTKIASLLTSDGLTETTDDSYGAIAVFTYATLSMSETAAQYLINWINKENKNADNRLPILGIVHSKHGLVLSSICASNIFNISLSFTPTIFCLDSNSFTQPKIARQVYDSRVVVEGYLVCSRPAKYFILYSQTSGIQMIGKDDAINAAEEAVDNKCKSTGLIIYSYDGGNLLHDCDLISYVKSLFAITELTKKKVIISSDLRTMSNKIATNYTGKVILANISNYALSGTVGFSSSKIASLPKDVIAQKRVPYIVVDKLFK